MSLYRHLFVFVFVARIVREEADCAQAAKRAKEPTKESAGHGQGESGSRQEGAKLIYLFAVFSRPSALCKS